jgi:hypothetical protein
MNPGEVVAILRRGDPDVLMASGRVIEFDADNNRVHVKIETHYAAPVFSSNHVLFEGLENRDDTTDWVQLRLIPGTQSTYEMQISPAFRIGSGTSDESKQNVDTTAQFALF